MVGRGTGIVTPGGAGGRSELGRLGGLGTLGVSRLNTSTADTVVDGMRLLLGIEVVFDGEVIGGGIANRSEYTVGADGDEMELIGGLI